MDTIGLDLHKRESQLCILTEAGEVAERRIVTSQERFAAVLAGYASDLMQKLLRLSDHGFFFWAADGALDVFAGYSFTLESRFQARRHQMSTPTAPLKWLAITAILATGLIHLGEARDAFGDALYKGLLFVANGVGALAATVGIHRNRRPWGWWLGLLVGGGAFIGYVVSRTVGLPGLAPEPDAWFEPAGVASLVFEALFILVFIVARRGSFRTLP